MKTALIFLTTGFEEIEALTTVDVLRRGGIQIRTVSLETSKTVIGGHDVPVIADVLFAEIKETEVDILIIPGGTVRIAEHQNLKDKITAFYNQGKAIAAICAAPMVLGQLGYLKGKNATCYPGFESYLEGSNLQASGVVTDGNLITAKGPAFSIDFALTILEYLTDKATRDEIAAGLLIA